MKKLLLNRIQSGTLALTAAMVLSGTVLMAQDATPPAAATGTSAGQRTDGQIEMDVVQALDASQALKNDLITAATIQTEVTLSGTVSTDASKQLAESIAAKVPGVTKVNNNLKIGNPAEDPNAQGAIADSTADNGDMENSQPSAPQQDYPAQQQGAQQPAYPQQPNYPQQQGSAPQQGYPQQGYPQNAPQSYPQGNPQGYPQGNPQGNPQGYPQQGSAQPPSYPPGYGPGYPPPPPGYGRQAYNPAPQPVYATPESPMMVPQGTILQLRTTDSIDNKRAREGTPVDFTVIRDVAINGYLAIPRGATVHGVVTESKKAGELTGSPELALKLTSLDIGGKNYPLSSDEFKVKGPNKTGHTVGNAIGGALLGAIIGGAAGGGGGAAIGAAAGGTLGTAASAAGPNPRAWIPAEALVTFHLAAPVTVDPVSQQEAARLAQGLYPGGPNLYRRSGYYGGPGPYGYPPVYYRPYFMSGGYYYWR